MGTSVISSNTSIRIDAFTYTNTLGAGTSTIYTASNNEYVEIFYANIANSLSFVRILYPNGATFDVLNSSTGQTFTTEGTANRVIVPPGCSIRVIQGSGAATAVSIYGTKFINSP